MLAAVGPVAFGRMLQWTQAWAIRDPAAPHWHLGPVAMDAHLQGKGIGSRLLAEYCRRLDSAGASGYLETDKPENVKSYSRFRFHSVGAARVLNTPNWFMLRDAAGEPKAAAVVRIESTASAQLAEDFCCLIAPIAMAEK
jgi:predicted N-acetyltransferase YhbS